MWREREREEEKIAKIKEDHGEAKRLEIPPPPPSDDGGRSHWRDNGVVVPAIRLTMVW